ncbi:SHOCT domain-containing protein [Mycolicibacterium sp. CAU 1645]|uniref:SHOCT domain-containing protein n=2 Tax=Mycolicibacterium arenosum TaxID=2952157 RepID=A0ABT1MBR9_9MYCO|nr:SHOCT domain-containing protein [Mycolicibacterium sp. CAU 1645]MCP9276608.1 SHOCT domain-containing protein [Mycolicibacterium sp. CAU 1645]
MSRSAPRALTLVGALTAVVAAVGFVVSLILNAFVFDEFDAYGEVSIPGSGSVALPAGEVLISFHTIVIGGSGSGLPVPRLSIDIVPPEGVAAPVLTEDIGASTFVNNDAHVRVWIAQVSAEGTYEITTDGNVGAFLDPSLAFGHGSRYGFLPWVFAAVFGLGLVALVIAGVWAARARRGAAQPFGSPAYGAPYQPPQQTYGSYSPSEQGIRLEQLNNLVRLRDSGALTQDEFEAEKKRILDGG